MSDVVRSGSAPASFQATLASLYGPEFAQAVGNISPTAFFNSLTKLGLSASDANDVMKAILSNPTPDLPLGGGTVGDAIPEAGAGLGGDVSLGGNAAAFAGAVLTEIGQATDNPDLAKAGEALSAAGGAVGTAASETAARGGS